MNIKEKAAELIQAQADYTNLDGFSYTEMEENNWDALLDGADNAIYRAVLGMDVKTAIEQPWHDEFLDEVCNIKNAKTKTAV